MRLNELTLISAPPGFGKTTLLGQWLAGMGGDRNSTAWVSLDAEDNDPTPFWSYTIAALQRTSPGLAAGAMARIRRTWTHAAQPLGRFNASRLRKDPEALEPGDEEPSPRSSSLPAEILTSLVTERS